MATPMHRLWRQTKHVMHSTMLSPSSSVTPQMHSTCVGKEHQVNGIVYVQARWTCLVLQPASGHLRNMSSW